MNLFEILGIIVVHWFADFVLQTDSQAKGKSKNWSDLLSHTATYSLVWCIVFAFLFLVSPWTVDQAFNMVILFPLITFVFHTVQDYITSRENSKVWEEKKIHKFFILIGFDQLLHYAQLFITYWLLMGK